MIANAMQLLQMILGITHTHTHTHTNMRVRACAHITSMYPNLSGALQGFIRDHLSCTPPTPLVIPPHGGGTIIWPKKQRKHWAPKALDYTETGVWGTVIW